MQNGTGRQDEGHGEGTALVPVSPAPARAASPERPPAPFVTQLVEARRRSTTLQPRCDRAQALKTYAGVCDLTRGSTHTVRVA